MPRALAARRGRRDRRRLRGRRPRLREAGLDGVEVVASHGYLPVAVPQPGGQPPPRPVRRHRENRLRFLRDVLDAIAGRAADEVIVVGLRISVDERDPSGLPADIAFAACRSLAAPGARRLPERDHRDVRLAGRLRPHRPRDVDRQRLHRAARRPGPGVVGRARPRRRAGSTSPRRRSASLAGAGRRVRDDPGAHLRPGHARGGRGPGELDDIRACIGCNQACIGHFHAGYPISCIQHPETGRESSSVGVRRRADAPEGDGRRRRTGRPEGGRGRRRARPRRHPLRGLRPARRPGAAGRAAARSGRSSAARSPTCPARRPGPGYGRAARRRRPRRRSARVRPDLVVVATGARPYRPPLEVMGSPWMLDAWEVIRRGDAGPREDGGGGLARRLGRARAPPGCWRPGGSG